MYTTRVSQHSGLYGDIVANICYLQDSENISTGNLVQRKNIKMTLENVIDQLIAHENVNRLVAMQCACIPLVTTSSVLCNRGNKIFTLKFS